MEHRDPSDSDSPNPPSSVFAKQFDLLKLELTLIDNAIRSHDEITKNIKQWAIVTWSGSVGLCISSPSLTPFLWATLFVPLTFWIVDGAFRSIQRSFIVRAQSIAAFLNSGAFIEAAQRNTPIDFPIMEMRSNEGSHMSWLAVMRFRTVAPLYLLMIFGSVLLGALVLTGMV